MNKTAIVIIIIVVVVGVGFWALQSGIFTPPSVAPLPIPEETILFYGDGCPHCKVVDDFISENQIEDKVSFTRLEVWYNKDNQNIISQVAQKCNIALDQVGVPLLWDGSSCYVGQDDVIDFFKNASNIQ